MKLAQFLFLVLAGCSMTPVRDARAQVEGGLPIPHPRGPLEFAAGTEQMTLHELALAFARLTGAELALDPMTQQQLLAGKIVLASVAPVPADEVYPFVESFLSCNGYSLCVLKLGARPIVTLVGGPPRPGFNPEPLFVAEEDWPQLEDHPALLVRLAVTFRNIDSRQLQTQLRQLLVDAGGLRQCVPAGERGLIVQGPGRETLALVRLLREMDASSAAPATPAPAPADAR
jgi:hypothetical protein